MRLVREQDGAVVSKDLRVAATFLTRLRGLLGRTGLTPGEALWIEPCHAIHMMFMMFAVDVLFVQRDGRGPVEPGVAGEVLAVCPRVRPWIGVASCPGARATVEMEAGRAQQLGLAAGDRLRVEAVSA